MKLFALALSTLLALPAFAQSLSCHDNSAGPDHGYSVTFSNDLKLASVTAESIAGPQIVATLTCVRVGHQGPAYPDQQVAFLACSEPNLRDAGYSLGVSTGGFIGGLVAELSEVTFVGSNSVAQFTCSQR